MHVIQTDDLFTQCQGAFELSVVLGIGGVFEKFLRKFLSALQLFIPIAAPTLYTAAGRGTSRPARTAACQLSGNIPPA